jgi:hypothetical protein
MSPNFFIKIGSLVRRNRALKKKWEKNIRGENWREREVIKDMVITLMLLQNSSK